MTICIKSTSLFIQRNRFWSSQRAWIADADTLFIATGYRSDGESATYGMYASHRGGDRGFVRIAGDNRLETPDYAGNNHFNTIGNLMLDSRAGLLFIDFATGSLLQLTGQATIDWDSKAVTRVPGARRLVESMNGRIDFAGTVGVGSTFWIDTPLSATDAEALDS